MIILNDLIQFITRNLNLFSYAKKIGYQDCHVVLLYPHYWPGRMPSPATAKGPSFVKFCEDGLTSDGLRASERKKDSNRDWHFRKKIWNSFGPKSSICFGAKKSSVTTLRAPRLGGDTFWGEPMRRWRRWWRWRRLWRRLSMSSIICLRKIRYGSQRSVPS